MAELADLAVCFELNLSSGGDLPEFIHILPAGDVIKGRDGRVWTHLDARNTLRNILDSGLKIPIDLNHSTQLQATKGEPAPAAGYVSEVFLKADGSMWGKVEWNDFGKDLIGNKKVKYISPAIRFDNSKADPKKGILGDIVGIASVGLVNVPNFDLTALNADKTLSEKEDKNMDFKEIIKLFGLPENTTEEEVRAKMAEIKTPKQETGLNAQQVQEMIVAGVQEGIKPLLEKATKDASDSHEVAVNAAIDKYVSAGKIQPTDTAKDYYKSLCGDADGLKRTCEFLDQAPVLVSTQSQINGNPPKGSGENGLTEDQKKLCHLLGISEKDYLETDPNWVPRGE